MPLMYRLDPALVLPKTERLERRGPRDFFIVCKTRDGYVTENRLSAASLRTLVALRETAVSVTRMRS